MHSEEGEEREVNISNHICILIARLLGMKRGNSCDGMLKNGSGNYYQECLCLHNLAQKNMFYSHVSLSASRHVADTDAFRI